LFYLILYLLRKEVNEKGIILNFYNYINQNNFILSFCFRMLWIMEKGWECLRWLTDLYLLSFGGVYVRDLLLFHTWLKRELRILIFKKIVGSFIWISSFLLYPNNPIKSSFVLIFTTLVPVLTGMAMFDAVVRFFETFNSLFWKLIEDLIFI